MQFMRFISTLSILMAVTTAMKSLTNTMIFTEIENLELYDEKKSSRDAMCRSKMDFRIKLAYSFVL